MILLFILLLIIILSFVIFSLQPSLLRSLFCRPIFRNAKERNRQKRDGAKERKGGGVEDLMTVQQKKYISDIKDDKLILKPVPETFTKKHIISYPYLKYFFPFEELQTIFEKIKTLSITLDNEPYSVDFFSKGGKKQIEQANTKFCGEWISFIKDYDGFYYVSLIDYFQEECRMRRHRVNAKTDFLTFFEANKSIIAKRILSSLPSSKIVSSPNFGEGGEGDEGGENRLTYLKIIDTAFKMYTPCSEFNPVWLTNMIPLFEKRSGPIRNMLDMSAGRGARMMACAALGINYLGVDPCECAHNNYPLMKKFAKYCGTGSKIKFIKSGFEEAWVMPEFFADKQFDLMFTSPPYFDLEIYEDTPGQSINKFTSLENWLENFLKVCMVKILSLLRPGGIMAMNIDNPIHFEKDYVNPMLNFKFDNAEYIGVIRIINKAKFHTWCWQKTG